MKKKKRSWLALFVASVVAILLVWSCAFLVWLFWGDLEGLVKRMDKKITSQEKVKPSQEILEEERKQLEEIIKRRK